MFEKIYRKLKEKNIEVYSIGQHRGKCESPFVVIKEYEPIEVVGSNYYNNKVNLICYYPLGSYSKVKYFKNDIAEAIEELKEFSRELLGNPIMVDDSKESYTFTLQYNNKKLRRY
ncbi:MAG: hypothetical protein RSC84_02565 [Peptostreptococcaceae bacterium]|uniref:hypothetical protein n=1 Tax=Clostridium sp. TaxID=1506 RepID=UPI00303F3F91